MDNIIIDNMNKTTIDNMTRQCVYNNAEVSSNCPIWLWVVLGVVILGLIGVLIWGIKKN